MYSTPTISPVLPHNEAVNNTIIFLQQFKLYVSLECIPYSFSYEKFELFKKNVEFFLWKRYFLYTIMCLLWYTLYKCLLCSVLFFFHWCEQIEWWIILLTSFQFTLQIITHCSENKNGCWVGKKNPEHVVSVFVFVQISRLELSNLGIWAVSFPLRRT